MLFYTTDDGSNGVMNLVPYTQFESESELRWAILYSRGQFIQDELNNLICLLSEKEGSRQSNLSIRLQNGFAAACDGVSFDDFNKYGEVDKTFLRSKYTSTWNNDQQYSQLHIAIYLGGPQKPRIPSSPSLSSHLYFAEALYNNNDSDQFPPWHGDWDGFRSPNGCSWGWHTRTGNSERDYIFLSGVFVAWMHEYNVALRAQLQSHNLDDPAIKRLSSNINHLNIFLRTTLFHELVHLTRTKLYGTEHNTPIQLIDHPAANRGSTDTGEAGRLAERIAFGSVVNLLKTDDQDIVLYSTDFDANPPASYSLAQVANSIFHPVALSPPISFETFDQNQEVPLSPSLVTAWERSKSKGLHGPTQVVDKINESQMSALPKRRRNLVEVDNFKFPPWETLPYKGDCIQRY